MSAGTPNGPARSQVIGSTSQPNFAVNAETGKDIGYAIGGGVAIYCPDFQDKITALFNG